MQKKTETQKLDEREILSLVEQWNLPRTAIMRLIYARYRYRSGSISDYPGQNQSTLRATEK